MKQFTLSGLRFHILIFIFSFLILSRFTFDPDLGWHLAIGSRFLESGEIVRGDSFSWTMPGYVFGNYFFLYQILVAFLFKYLGFVLSAIAFGTVGSLAVLLLVPKVLDFYKLFAVFLGVGVAATSLGLRPHMISFLFFSVLLVLLEKKYYLSRLHALFWLGFFALWANFHQGFFMGVLTLAVFVGCDFLWQISRQKKNTRTFVSGRIFSVGAAALGGFLTPFHGQVWGSAINDLFGSKTWLSVAEWQPVVIYLPWSLLYGISGLLFAYILFKKFKDNDPVWFLLAAFIFMLPFLAVNFVLFWAAIFIFIASRHLEISIDFKKSRLARLPLFFSSVAAAVALILGFFLGVVESWNLEYRLEKDGYPVSAVKFLKKESLTAGIFNSYGWGGFIDWQFPEARVFIDGRMTGWRKEDGSYMLADYLAILQGKCEVANKYDIQVVLMEKDFKNDCFSNFHEVYLDSVSKILVKS